MPLTYEARKWTLVITSRKNGNTPGELLSHISLVADSASYSTSRIINRAPRLSFGRFRIFYERKEPAKAASEDISDFFQYKQASELPTERHSKDILDSFQYQQASELPTERPVAELGSVHERELCLTEECELIPIQELPESVPEKTPRDSSSPKVDAAKKHTETEPFQQQPLPEPRRDTSDLRQVSSLAQQGFISLESRKLRMESQISPLRELVYEGHPYSSSSVSSMTLDNHNSSAFITQAEFSPTDRPMPFHQEFYPPSPYYPARGYGQWTPPNVPFYPTRPITEASAETSAGSSQMMTSEQYYSSQATQYPPPTTLTTFTTLADRKMGPASIVSPVSTADPMAWAGLDSQSPNRESWSNTSQCYLSPARDLNAIGSHIDAENLAPYHNPTLPDHKPHCHPAAEAQIWRTDLRDYSPTYNQAHQSEGVPLTTEYLDMHCSFCPAKFTGRFRKGNLTRHARGKHQANVSVVKIKCSECGQAFKRSDARRKHQWNIHRIESSKPKKRQTM